MAGREACAFPKHIVDPQDPRSLITFALGRLPLELVSSPTLRGLNAVKTLERGSGVITDLHFFAGEHTGTGVRSISDTQAELDLKDKPDQKVLDALSTAAGFDIASVRRELLNQFRADPEALLLIDTCEALQFDRAMRKRNEHITAQYVRGLFQRVLQDGFEDIKTTGQLVTALEAAARSGDKERVRQAKTHIDLLCHKFGVEDDNGLTEFLKDFDLLSCAVAYYRGYFLELAPHMSRLSTDLADMEKNTHGPAKSLLHEVNVHLIKTQKKCQQFFDAFDQHFDRILETAEPDTFKELHASLQEAYATIGALLCGWGLRLHTWHESIQKKNIELASHKLDVFRTYIANHLLQKYPDPDDLEDYIHTMLTA